MALRLGLLLAFAFVMLADLAVSVAGEIVRGPVHVCRKPMLAGHSSFAALVNPGPDAWRLLAERQADEARYCYMAGSIELIEKGPDIDVGSRTSCTEWRATAGNEMVFVVIGSNRTWGSCP